MLPDGLLDDTPIETTPALMAADVAARLRLFAGMFETSGGSFETCCHAGEAVGRLLLDAHARRLVPDVPRGLLALIDFHARPDPPPSERSEDDDDNHRTRGPINLFEDVRGGHFVPLYTEDDARAGKERPPSNARMGGLMPRAVSDRTGYLAMPRHIQSAETCAFLAAAIESATGKSPPPDSAPPAPRLTVDLDRMTVTLDGTPHDVTSERALRWVRVLAGRPGLWVSSRELENADPELHGVRTDRLGDYLPEAVQLLINSEPGRGSRIRL